MRSGCRSFVLLLVFVLFGASEQLWSQATGSLAIGLNRIEGRITDESNNGVYNAYVELYDNLGTLVRRERSGGQGRFSFKGMGPGRYTVAVKPFGTNLREETRDIVIDNSASRSDMAIVDIRLRKDDRFRTNEDRQVVGTVFAQEVPADAKRLYRSAIDVIETDPERALNDLDAAVKLFPKYFDALAALGKTQIVKAKYEVGYPYLLRAIDINPKCPDCYYSLALAFYKLNEGPAAAKAIDAAAILQPQSAIVRLLQGMIYRQNQDFAGAEKALQNARSLFKTPNAEVHWQLSLVYNRLKRNKEAADELELYLKAKTDITAADRENVRGLIAKLRGTN